MLSAAGTGLFPPLAVADFAVLLVKRQDGKVAPLPRAAVSRAATSMKLLMVGGKAATNSSAACGNSGCP